MLSEATLTVPQSVLIAKGDSIHDSSFPAVIKSQVPVGGRGKLGGVRKVSTLEELKQATSELFAHEIKGYLPNKLLIEELLAIDKEHYLALLVDRSARSVELSAHSQGGVDIESHAAQGLLRLTLTKKNFEAAGEALAETYNLPAKTFALQDLVEKLYDCFVSNDATLLEINPLILTKQGEIVAGDCKMILDDAASFRHPDWDFEETPANANFVTLDPLGRVATIANGAGLAMATVDAIARAGYSPANFLDIGGGATTEQVVASFRHIMDFPNVTAIVINIFGGIVRCDTVAEAIIEAKKQTPNLPRLIVRLSGNHSDEASKLLKHHSIPLYQDLTECIESIA